LGTAASGTRAIGAVEVGTLPTRQGIAPGK
jgi:hypothetical protein